MLIERLNAFTLLKSVDNGKLFQALIILQFIWMVYPVYYSTCKETAFSGAGTTGFVQLVHVATCYSSWAQLEQVITHQINDTKYNLIAPQ